MRVMVQYRSSVKIAGKIIMNSTDSFASVEIENIENEEELSKSVQIALAKFINRQAEEFKIIGFTKI
ncbi:hypothetical protein V7056_00035 [Bacillus sp. JJ664]